MLYAILNAFLYIGLFYWYRRRYKVVDEIVLLLAIWATVGSVGLLLVCLEPTKYQLMLWPYIYLFVTFLVFVHFLLQRQKHLFPVEKFIKYRSIILDIINYIYILCSIYELLNIDLSVLSITFLSEEAKDLYQAAHESKIIVKDALFYCQRFTSAMFVLTAISVFNYLAQKRTLMGWSLFSFTLISIIAGIAEIASRGTMMSQILVFVVAYLIYKPYLNVEISKTIRMVFLMAGIFLAAFFVAITTSRFKDSYNTGYKSPLESVVSYFGQSMLYFNYGICDVDFNTWGGSRTFNYLASSFLGIDYRRLPEPGTHYGSGFTTFIGMLVQDFGYVGTVILGFMVSYIMYKLWSIKNKTTFAGMYIYLFYINRMVMGVFVTPPGSDYYYLWALLTYLFLLYILKPSKPSKVVENAKLLVRKK